MVRHVTGESGMQRWTAGWIAAVLSLACCAAAAQGPAKPHPGAGAGLPLHQRPDRRRPLPTASPGSRTCGACATSGWPTARASEPRQVTRYAEDDGQELTGLTFSPDGARLLYVRGGDHDANWAAEGKLAPDPAASPEEPKVTIWSAAPDGGAAPVKLAEGDVPALSARGVLAYVKDDQVWTTTLDGRGKPERLAFDRGKARSLAWSPDGSKLAFVSDRGDHAFVAVYTDHGPPAGLPAALHRAGRGPGLVAGREPDRLHPPAGRGRRARAAARAHAPPVLPLVGGRGDRRRRSRPGAARTPWTAPIRRRSPG